MENIIKELVDGSELSHNEIVFLAGAASHTYLMSLIRGKIKTPRRQKLINLGMALNLSMEELEKLLLRYNYRDITGNQRDVDALITWAGLR